MEFQLQVGFGVHKIHGRALKVLDLVERAVTLELDGDEINLVEGMRIFVKDPLVQNHGSFVTLARTTSEMAVFDLREKKIQKKEKNLAKKIARNEIKRRTRRSIH